MTEDHDDFAFEPVPGLPEQLPSGESMLWQGSPQWRRLAVEAFHVRKVAVYFALLLLFDLATAWRDGSTVPAVLAMTAWLVGVALVAIGILCLLAFLYARGTIYTLTTRRIVIRSGLALPVTLNLPLALIGTASVASGKGSSGSIALTVVKPNRIAWLVLWPNVRPWRLTNPQPMLRCLDDVAGVAAILGRALEADAGVAGMRTGVVSAPAAQSPMPAGASFAA